MKPNTFVWAVSICCVQIVLYIIRGFEFFVKSVVFLLWRPLKPPPFPFLNHVLPNSTHRTIRPSFSLSLSHTHTLSLWLARLPLTCIDIGCGAGRDAVWLARRGWAVRERGSLELSCVSYFVRLWVLFCGAVVRYCCWCWWWFAVRCCCKCLLNFSPEHSLSLCLPFPLGTALLTTTIVCLSLPSRFPHAVPFSFVSYRTVSSLLRLPPSPSRPVIDRSLRWIAGTRYCRRRHS